MYKMTTRRQNATNDLYKAYMREKGGILDRSFRHKHIENTETVKFPRLDKFSWPYISKM